MELNLNNGNILISGRCGTGKSYLVRSLLSSEVFLNGGKHRTCIFYLDYHINDVEDLEKSFILDKYTTVYGEAEPEEGTISEVLHTVVAQYEYRNELIKDNKVGNIEDCAGIVVNTFIFQDRKYMPDDIVKVETDNGYNYILAKDLPKFVKNVEFSPCKYDPATTVLALDECFIIEDNTSIRLLELILRDGQSKEQKVIKTCQYLGQLHGIPATLFPTKVELTGRKVGVVCHNGVFSNYEI